MNVCIRYCVVSSVLLYVYYTRVVSILVLAFKCKELFFDGGLFVRDGGYDTVQEDDVRPIDVHDGWVASLHGGSK